jgi:hypothetical protein
MIENGQMVLKKIFKKFSVFMHTPRDNVRLKLAQWFLRGRKCEKLTNRLQTTGDEKKSHLSFQIREVR